MAKRVAARTPKTTSKRGAGDVHAERDAILGDQVNFNFLVLGAPDAPIAFLRGQADDAILSIGAGPGAQRLTQADLDRVWALSRNADPLQRERSYLARFILSESYAQWERGYLKLAGRLREAPRRITDPADQAMSSAGEQLEDLRDALGPKGKPHLVIVGAPGAGKTTALERLALDLARARMRNPSEAHLPFRVDLFEFTAADPDPETFLKHKWENAGLAQSYGDATAAGEVCFLLDGLNQMPMADREVRLQRWLQWHRALPPGNWAVFTCRVADYMPNLLLPVVHVLDLDEGRIREYLEVRLGETQGAAAWTTFSARLRSADDRFWKLARNPFMLARLVDRLERGRDLTDNRAELMDDLARDLLDRELFGGRQPPELLTNLPRTVSASLDALGRLAFEMQLKGEGTGLTRAVAEATPLDEKASLTLDQALRLATGATVLECVDGRADEPDAVYAFFHHLLQEYFAGRDLLRRFKAGEDLTPRWAVAWQTDQAPAYDPAKGEGLPPAETTGWEETAILAAALAAITDARLAQRLIAAVESDNLPLAGRCLAAAGVAREGLASLADPLRVALLTRQQDRGAGLRARIEAGLALGEVGHPDLLPQSFTFEGRVVSAILPPLQAVPAGAFIRGSDSTDTRAFTVENTTERSLELQAFAIGRYPVTNAEFRLFVDDPGGYASDRWWDADGLRWKAGGPDAHAGPVERWLITRKVVADYGVEKAGEQFNWSPSTVRYWKEVVALSDDEARERARRVFMRPFDHPAFWDDPSRTGASQPVVGVNWHEVSAYCRWLSAVTGQTFELPAETQWEKAARGVDGREYPWGEDFDATRSNTVESRIDGTTPVGLYPDGAAPCGALDVSGNVWEWTADWYQPYPGGDPNASDEYGETHRVVRGGSWNNNRQNARCAYRTRTVPDNFRSTLGFRVVSPVLS